MNSLFTSFRRPWDNGLAWVVILLGSVTLAGLPAVMALSLGDLAVESHLGRPFSATVQLLNSSGEERRGECRKEILPVPRVPYLIRPRIRLEKRDGKSSLRITTSAPIGEPVVGLSVRLDCDQPKGTIVRDYKVLLDPVGYGSRIPTGATPQPAMPVKDLSKPAGPAWKAPPEAKQRRSPAVADLSRFDGYRTVEVLPGDTLYRIISDIYGGDSVERSLIFDAIIAANPRIFPGGDPDRLREGVKLRVPDTGAWDGYSLEGEPVSSPEPRVDSGQKAVSPKSGLRILSAAEESWQVSLKLAWEFDEARLVSNERRLPQELDTGETVEVVAVAPEEGPEIDAVEGEGNNGTEVEEAGVNTGTARLELVVAEARIEELNQEITQLRRILEVQERPPVPVSPSQPVSMPAILAGFPWYGWLIGGLAILLLATGLYQLVGRRAVVDGSIPVAPGPIESESIPQFLPGEISEIPPAEPTNRHEGQGGKPLEQNEASTNQDPVAKRVAEIAGIPPSPSPAQDPIREQVRVQEPEIGGVMPDSWRDQRQTVHGLEPETPEFDLDPDPGLDGGQDRDLEQGLDQDLDLDLEQGLDLELEDVLGEGMLEAMAGQNDLEGVESIANGRGRSGCSVERGGEVEVEEDGKSVPAMLLEVELHLLYEQHNEAVSILELLVARDNDSKPDTRSWSMLFDAYRNLDRSDEFEGLAARFRQRYNIVPPEWGQDETEQGVNGLEEKFPRVLKKIIRVWDSDEILAMLYSLLLDDRNGERRGFDLDVANELSLLLDIVTQRD